jgi:hypothetical protein
MTYTELQPVANPRRVEIDVEEYATLTITLIGGTGPNTTGLSFGFFASPDSVSKESGAWPMIQGQGSDAGAMFGAVVGTSVTANVVNPRAYTFNVAAFKRFRMAVTAMSGGPFTVAIGLSKVPTAFTPIAPLATQPVSLASGTSGPAQAEDAAHASGHIGIPSWGVRNDGAVTVFTSANGDYSPTAVDNHGSVWTVGAYLEDAPHVSGDPGTAILGVRAPAVPAAQTSAAGDYGALAIDAEGKQIPSGQGAPELTLRGMAATNGQTNVQLIAAPAAGLRLHITDVIIAGGGAAGVAIILKSGTTDFARINPGVAHSFKTPLRLNAAEALNAVIETGNSNVWVTVLGYTAV